MKRNLRGLLLFTRKVLAYFSFRRDNDKRDYEKLFITALGDMTRTAMQAATKTEHLNRNRRGDRMRICIEESTYEGTPIEILTQLRALHFDAGTFDGTEGYIRYMQNTIRRMTEQPCELPESSTGERAAALIRVLSEIGALELLEE
jgi:hypothetical protein